MGHGGSTAASGESLSRLGDGSGEAAALPNAELNDAVEPLEEGTDSLRWMSGRHSEGEMSSAAAAGVAPVGAAADGGVKF